jgi:hypothetical protein
VKHKRDMAAARRKAEEEGCRLCGSTFAVEAAHVLSRARIKPGPAEDLRNIVGLCGHLGCDAHRSFDEGTLDLLPYLTNVEQAYAVELVGICEAFQRITHQRLAA